MASDALRFIAAHRDRLAYEISMARKTGRSDADLVRQYIEATTIEHRLVTKETR